MSINKVSLLKSSDCYEGYNESNDSWITGTYQYLLAHDEIDEDTIEFSQLYWEDISSHFYYFLESEKNKYEKRYNTEIIALVLCGEIGLWHSSPIGGMIVDFDSIFNIDVDDIEVFINKDDTLEIHAYHHDGTHKLNLFFLTESSMKKAGVWKRYNSLGFKDFRGEEFKKIYDSLTPLKLTKDNKFYNYDIYAIN